MGAERDEGITSPEIKELATHTHTHTKIKDRLATVAEISLTCSEATFKRSRFISYFCCFCRVSGRLSEQGGACVCVYLSVCVCGCVTHTATVILKIPFYNHFQVFILSGGATLHN